MDKHEEYKRLYKKYVDGKRWLERRERQGTVTEKDRTEFKERVIDPMEKIRATFTEEERAYWERVRMAIDLFNGTIVLESGHKQKQEGRQWTHGQGVSNGFKRSGSRRTRMVGPRS